MSNTVKKISNGVTKALGYAKQKTGSLLSKVNPKNVYKNFKGLSRRNKILVGLAATAVTAGIGFGVYKLRQDKRKSVIRNSANEVVAEGISDLGFKKDNEKLIAEIAKKGVNVVHHEIGVDSVESASTAKSFEETNAKLVKSILARKAAFDAVKTAEAKKVYQEWAQKAAQKAAQEANGASRIQHDYADVMFGILSHGWFI